MRSGFWLVQNLPQPNRKGINKEYKPFFRHCFVTSIAVLLIDHDIYHFLKIPNKYT